MKIRSGQESVLVCRNCGGPIEPIVARRIVMARQRRVPAPLLCRNCYLRSGRRAASPEMRQQGKASISVNEWACVKCGAALEPEEVDEVKHGKTIECIYCGSAITLDLFR